MTKVVILGSGIVGSSIAYKLSNYPQLDITLIDAKNPGTGSTGAALGVLMGIISRKTKGRAWNLRESSLQRYTTLIPELEELTGLSIPYNRHGIVKLLFSSEEIAKYEKLAQVRSQQGYELQIWTSDILKNYCREIDTSSVVGAVYSPSDKQINPTSLTQALVKAASLQGVECIFGEKVEQINSIANSYSQQQNCREIHLQSKTLLADWIVVATCLGTYTLIESLGFTLAIKPVLGQALLIKYDNWRHNSEFNPVITGNDVHIVPMKNNEFWLGATVEFPTEEILPVPNQQLLNDLQQNAIAFCPNLTNATVILSWTGKRPRPDGKAAPVIEKLPNYSNILLATGHYRNGILLAPATADVIASMILE